MRIFLALKFSEEEKRNINIHVEEYRKHFTHLRWTRVENYHCTLFFIGEMNEESVTRLRASLHEYDLSMLLTPITLSPAEFFHTNDHATVVQLPVAPPYQWLKELYVMVKPIVDNYNPVVHNTYIPHITIARTKQKFHKTDYSFFEENPVSLSLSPHTLVLYQSTSDSEGLLYQEIDSFSLR